jgi:hypothetical protein
VAQCICGAGNECKNCDGTTQYYPPIPFFYQNSYTNGQSCNGQDINVRILILMFSRTKIHCLVVTLQ